MTRLVSAIVAIAAAALGLAFFAGAASAGPAPAEETVWLCQPGQEDNPCVGNLSGTIPQPDGGSVPLDLAVAEDPPIDCFYLYPTQSAQTTANANLDKDPEIRAVAVNQARQFSRVCDVYAPMYRQYTFQAPITDEVRDIAYNSALGAWNDYIRNHNDGRGVVIVAHSQGTSNMARLIAEEVDGNPAVRKRLISAILPGANVYVPKGGLVGGQFQNIPACEAGDQVGCVIAYSMFTKEPLPNQSFGRVGSGYWVNPAPRPDPAVYEVLCVNPAQLTGDAGILRPLANIPAFLGLPEGDRPWQTLPDFYRGECRSSADANWLNVEDIRPPGDQRTDLSSLINRNGDLHLGDINLALDSLVSVTASQGSAYIAAERRKAVKRRGALRKRIKKVRRQEKRVKARAKKAKKACRNSGRACGKARKLSGKSKKLKRKTAKLKKKKRVLTKEIKTLVVPAA